MELTFYKCEHCGNFLIPVIDSGVTPVCCGSPMEKLQANTTDAAVEKHVPVIEREADGKHVCVSVGEAPHPMADDHYIEFVVIVRDDRFGVINLKPGDEPKVCCAFDDISGPVIAYAYCNLHGIWKAEA